VIGQRREIAACGGNSRDYHVQSLSFFSLELPNLIERVQKTRKRPTQNETGETIE
jgi:hypothetical protein